MRAKKAEGKYRESSYFWEASDWCLKALCMWDDSIYWKDVGNKQIKVDFQVSSMSSAVGLLAGNVFWIILTDPIWNFPPAHHKKISRLWQNKFSCVKVHPRAECSVLSFLPLISFSDGYHCTTKKDGCGFNFPARGFFWRSCVFSPSSSPCPETRTRLIHNSIDVTLWWNGQLSRVLPLMDEGKLLLAPKCPESK